MSNNQSDDEFFERHAPIVYNLALRLTGNRADAEDLAQDALLRALKGLSRFRGDSQLTSWVYRITVNTWKNRVRFEKRRGWWKTVSLGLFSGEDQDEEPAFKADDPPLDAALESEERDHGVQAALMGLDEESRAVLLLREIEGRSYEEIGRDLEMPMGTVKSKISRAREALREKLMRSESR